MPSKMRHSSRQPRRLSTTKSPVTERCGPMPSFSALMKPPVCCRKHWTKKQQRMRSSQRSLRTSTRKPNRQRKTGEVKADIAIPMTSCEKENAMNWDQVKGNWTQLTGKVKEKWGKLTDDDLTSAAGHRDQLLGKIQERYGYAKEKAEEELDKFVGSM